MRTAALNLFVGLMILGSPGTAWAEDDAPTKEDFDALRKEVRELREWKARVEAEEEVGVSAAEQAVDEYLARHTMEGPEPILVPGANGLTISGEIRVRTDVFNHVYHPMDPGGRDQFESTHLRTRLRFDLAVEDGLDVVVEFQDVRVFGDEGSTAADSAGVDVKRAYVKFADVLGSGFSLKLGRFVLAYGDQRIIGHLEWVDQGRTYDGFLFQTAAESGAWLDIFGVRVRDSVRTSDDQDAFGLYGGFRGIAENHDLEGYVILFRDLADRMGERSMGNTRFLTLGTRFTGKTDAFDYTAEAALQAGEVDDDDLSAWAAAVKLGYTLDGDWNPRLGFGCAYATGNESPSDGDTEQFQVLFPTNHAHYGSADLAAWSNLLDIEVGVSVTPCEGGKLSLVYHHFRLVDPDGGWINAGGGRIRPGTSGNDRHLGDEIDLTFAYKASEALSFLFGYSRFIAGEFVEDTGRSPDSDFGYVQVRVRF